MLETLGSMESVGPKRDTGSCLRTSGYHAVSATLLQKYFGKKEFTAKHPRQQNLTKKFLAKALKIKPETIRFSEGGQLLLDREASRRMAKGRLDDTSFLTDGGKAEAIYEGVEMACNDVMAGTVQAGGLMEPVRDLIRRTGQALPDSVKALAASLRVNGALEMLTGAGVAATVGLGLWLGYSGSKQAIQGVARGDQEQALRGARHLFLGSESLLTGTVLAAKVGRSALLKTAGTVAARLATPFALVHGAIDLAEGLTHLRAGVKDKDGLSVLEGVSELGMGVGWAAAAFGATPALVAVSCACLAGKIGVAAARSRQRKKEREALLAYSLELPKQRGEQMEKYGEKHILHVPAPSTEPPKLQRTGTDGKPENLSIRFE